MNEARETECALVVELNFQKRTVTVQTEKEIDVAEVAINKYEVEQAIRDYIRSQFKLGKAYVVKHIEPDIDWRGEEYLGFRLEVHEGA